jgi:hypothetical protein
MAQYDYDIAFSFLAQDEGTATQINDLLQDRYKTFLYSERQKELAGTDGEKTFNEVFSEQARTVAVLYRPGWGQSPWTRIEETAIRNRAHDHGYDFATFIAMTDPVTAPRWLPKTRILYGLTRFGIPGAAAALDARIQEQGGEGAEETVMDRAARLQRSQHLASERERFQKSEIGVKAATAAYEQLIKELVREAANLQSAGVKFQPRDPYGGYKAFVGQIVVLILRFEHHYANSLDGAKLHADFYRGFPRMPGVFTFQEAPSIDRGQFTFELVGIDRPAWVSKSQKEYAPDAMPDFTLKLFMDHEERQRAKGQ